MAKKCNLNQNNATLHEAREDYILNAGIQIGYQKALDYMSVVLQDPKYVGKDIFGEARWLRIEEGLQECGREFGEAFTGSVNADVCQEKLDTVLKKVYKKHFAPFYERYTEIKRFKYNRSKKGWK